MENYLEEMQKLGMTLFGLMGQAVEIDKKEMIDVFDDGMQSIRMTYYPPCPQPDLVIGLTPHSDVAGITILLQVNDVEGLQVKKDGVWIPVSFLPDALIVNVGDILEGREESVQELAKEHNQLITTVPHHYVQEHREPTFVSNDSPSIPVIDMNDLIMGQGSHTTDLQMKNLRSVCHEWGIFQLVNHGIEKSLVEKMKHEISEFFKMPVEEKLGYKLKGRDEYEGYGQTILHAQHQKIDWADRFYMITNPLHKRKPNLLPHFPPSLRDTLEKYLQQLQNLGMTLLGLVGEAVDIKKEEMLQVFEDGMQSVRMTYYPPCPQPDLVVGLTPHSDAAGITILLQVNDVQGLEVKKDGRWIPVNVLSDAFVVNIGDILEILSNGVYNSIEHRALVNATKERMSLAMFFNPKLEADVGPSKSLLRNTGNPPLYKTLVMEQYLKDFFLRKLDGKTFLEKMKIKNEEGNET